jgi:fluoride ion exporter CrcB/FEX
MLSYLWISIGGAIGSAARFWISGIVTPRCDRTFPSGTLTVNVWLGYFPLEKIKVIHYRQERPEPE